MKRRYTVLGVLAAGVAVAAALMLWPRGPSLPEAAPSPAAELASPEFAAWARERRWQPEEMVPGKLAVCFARGVAVERRRQVAAAVGGSIERDRVFRDGTSASLIALPPSASLRGAIEACGRLDGVASAQPVFRLRQLTNDPYFPELWSLHNTGQTVHGTQGTPDADIDAVEAWTLEQGDPSVVIAVIDNGAEFTHPDLAPNNWYNPGETGAGKEGNGVDDDGNGYVDDWRGWNFVDNDNNTAYDPANEKYSHGTDMAVVAGGLGDNGVAGAGIAWRCTLMHLVAATDWDINDAVRYATDNGARVVNISLGKYSFSDIERGGIAYARDHGVLVCCAGGNEGRNNDVTPNYPSSYDLDNIIAVAATNQNDALWGNSNYGATTVDLAAPGHNIRLGSLGRTTLFEHDLQGTIVFADDFDRAGPGLGPDWTLGQDSGGPNYWEIYFDSAWPYPYDEPYPGDSKTWIESREFSTVGLTAVGLSYFYYVECEANHDYLSVEVWDGSSWHEVRRHSSPVSAQGVQDFVTVNITPYAGPTTKVRFLWTTDGDNNDFYGAFIDDVFVAGLASGWVTGKSSGTDGWATAPDGRVVANGDATAPYSANAHTWLATADAFDAAGAAEVFVCYEYTLDSEPGYDYLGVEVWDGSTWRELERHSELDPLQPEGQTIRSAVADATAYANAQMRLRFVWYSDQIGSNYYGAEVHDVEVSRLGGSEYDTLYTQRLAYYAEGTSVACPLVAGTAGLLWSHYPSLTYQQVRDTILTSVDVKPGLAGKCVTGGRLNAYQALASLSYPPAAPIGLAASPATWTSLNAFDLSWTNPDHPVPIAAASYKIGVPP